MITEYQEMTEFGPMTTHRTVSYDHVPNKEIKELQSKLSETEKERSWALEAMNNAVFEKDKLHGQWFSEAKRAQEAENKLDIAIKALEEIANPRDFSSRSEVAIVAIQKIKADK